MPFNARMSLVRLLLVLCLAATASCAVWAANTECQADVTYEDAQGRVTGGEQVPMQWLVETGVPDRAGKRQVWVRVEEGVVGWTDAARLARQRASCAERALQAAAEAGNNPCVLRWYQFDNQGKVTGSDTFDVRRAEAAAGVPLTEARLAALPAKLGYVELRDAQAGGSAWFAQADVRLALRHLPLCARADKAAAAATGSSAGATNGATASRGATPTGSLQLLCQLPGGRAYVFVVDEGRQTVSVRDSGGQDWVSFRNGQVTRQRVGERMLPMIDTVQVDAQAIRVLRQPQDERPAAGGRPKGEADELLGALGDLMLLAGTATSVAIDRNTAVIRTGGMGMFPNNASGMCEPWSGRRF